QLVLDKALADRERIGVELLEDRLRETWPAPVAPRHRRILAIGIVADIDRIDQPLAALPVQRGTLPGLMCNQDPDQSGFAVGVIGVEKPTRTFAATEHGILGSRAALEDADQVLEALLTGTGSFRAAHCVRHVADEYQAAAPAVLGDRKVCVARHIRLY